MKINPLDIAIAVVISTVIMISFPLWAKKTVERWVPWGEHTE